MAWAVVESDTVLEVVRSRLGGVRSLRGELLAVTKRLTRDYPIQSLLCEVDSLVVELLATLALPVVPINLTDVACRMAGESLTTTTHRKLVVCAIEREPILLRLVTTPDAPSVLRFTDRWRTLPVLAAAIGLAHHLRG